MNTFCHNHRNCIIDGYSWTLKKGRKRGARLQIKKRKGKIKKIKEFCGLYFEKKIDLLLMVSQNLADQKKKFVGKVFFLKEILKLFLKK